MNEPDEIFGEVIYKFSREDAIKSGVLVDLSRHFPVECKIYRYPVACTEAVWSLIEQSAKNRKAGNSMAGVVGDILWMSQRGIVSRPDEQSAIFNVIITGTGRKHFHSLKAACGPGDNFEPVITIMLPDED